MAQFTQDTRILGYYRGVYDSDYKVENHPYHTVNGVVGFRRLDPTELADTYNKIPNSRFNFNYVKVNHYDANIKYTHFQMRVRCSSRNTTIPYDTLTVNGLPGDTENYEHVYKEGGVPCPFIHVCYDMLAGPSGAQYYERKYAVSVALGVTGSSTEVPTTNNIRVPGIFPDYIDYMNSVRNSRTFMIDRDDRLCATIYEETVLGATKHYAVLKHLESGKTVTSEIPATVSMNEFYVVVDNVPGGFFTYLAWMGYNNLADIYDYEYDGLGNPIVVYNTYCSSNGELVWDKYSNPGGPPVNIHIAAICFGTVLANTTETDGMFETVLENDGVPQFVTKVNTDGTTETVHYHGIATSPELRLNIPDFKINATVGESVNGGAYDARLVYGLIRDFVIYQSDSVEPQNVDTRVVELGPVTNLYCMNSSYTGLGQHFKQGQGDTYAEKLARIQADSMTLDYLGGAFIGKLYLGATLNAGLQQGEEVEKVVMSYNTSGRGFTVVPPIPECTVANYPAYGFQTANHEGPGILKHHHPLPNVSGNSNVTVKIKLFEQGT